MRQGNFKIQAPLILGGQVSEAEVLGASVWLWMHSAMHRDAPLHVLPTVLLPIVKRQQYVLVTEEERPVFFLSWMWLNMETETRYLTESTVMIKDEDWCSGDRVWFRDFIAPFGHTRAMSRLLRDDILPDYCARFLWHRGEAIRPSIKTFRGKHVTRDKFRAWKALNPPQSKLLHC
ncbi:toxin-activating lysine-acyltransferase [Enterobacteriaceae bacterium H20N1]|uniref:RTX toxin-activating lysine-acyltransferase n=1 Tax=Dryocola boscaweniae TaxID=2925397 RepID=A0A9X3AMJ9_9ENTR|nr:toxin-activating lysine-acyltransferase [Dryocola boscaweniae]MCT4701377.1 toxin-activating lysine-acyltransferase [Dryocola boscaweniae]MCT4716624.1 toxin-activating lysine-acyltransferase [Dryocola boscaweniae]MCT4718712.1 toxin-activating lysine-acyltransferase [Dryocola boscaweniae]